jgi:hypothetical protein
MKFCCGGRVNSSKEFSDFAKVTAFEVIVTCPEKSICLDYFFYKFVLSLKIEYFLYSDIHASWLRKLFPNTKLCNIQARSVTIFI